ncbi:hypothetical protein SELMODRAFT_418963 [Selaginella moellendorffii]|uniref:Uncharacterized protein n=1 Tax=Selaginella moellendorffii TaxID=88036 RepID=D8S7D2_SELML|nr:hypothetical protein SELMODRAFT_418963 [Selaginella moellendorffii]
MEEYREKPFWRQKGMSTSAMVEEITRMCSRYENLGAPEKDWAAKVYSPRATTEWLFQVNKIEGEGFDTLQETQQAIHKDGVLGMEMHDDCDERIKNVWGLNQALVPWFFRPGEEKFGSGGIGLLLESHKSMFCFTRPSIAGRLRNLSEARGSWRKAPDFVDRDDYLECFRIAQGSVDEVPRDITAMVIEGVYVGWKRFFGALEAAFPSIRVENRLDHAHSRQSSPVEDDRPKKRRRKSDKRS